MRINTNVNALVAYRNLSGINSQVSDSMSKLSTGFRINRAADDAAGLGIANKLRAETRALGQASRNAEQANSVLQIAEGATSSIQKALERMKELATQAGSDSVDAEGRERIDAEFNALRAEITRTVDTTKFQGNALLDGSFGSLPAQLEAGDVTVGAAAAGGTYSITATDAGVITLSTGGTAVGSIDLADATNNTSGATASFASGTLTLSFGSGTGAISLAVDATSATDAASVVEALDGKGFQITAATTGSATSPTATGAGAAVAGDYSGTNEVFQVTVDGATQSITLDGDYTATAPTPATAGSAAVPADFSGTNYVFSVTVDGDTQNITLSGDHSGGGGLASMITEINTALDNAFGDGTAGSSALQVSDSSGSLRWAHSGTGADADFAVDETGTALGGDVSGTGAGGVSAMISAINTKLDAAFGGSSSLQVAAGAGGALTWSHSGTGTTSTFSVTDSSGDVLGGDITLTAGTDGAAPAALTANSITGNSEEVVAKFLVGASGAYQTDDTISLDAMDLSITALGLDTASLATADGAREALTSIDAAMSTLNETLGSIGANQNRLENTMANLKTTILNFTAAESVVRDLDMAEEMMKFSKNNILAQAATSMLAQANASSQGILQLLRG